METNKKGLAIVILIIIAIIVWFVNAKIINDAQGRCLNDLTNQQIECRNMCDDQMYHDNPSNICDSRCQESHSFCYKHCREIFGWGGIKNNACLEK